MTTPFVSIHGRRLGLTPFGLMMDGRIIGGSTPTGLGRGKTIYVDSAVDGADGASPASAVGTLAEVFANDMVTANQGDTVVGMPNHAETIDAAGDITIDIAGVSIIGLGRGLNRPTFTFSTAATGTIAVTGADTFIQNCVFTANYADVATCFDLDAKGFTLHDCEFNAAGANLNWLAIITAGSTTDNVCDGIDLQNNYWYDPDAACTHFLAQTGHIDRMTVIGNTVIIPGSTAGELIDVTSGDLFRGARIIGNILQHAMTAGELFISNDGSTNSGVIAHNRVGHADVTTSHDLGIDALGWRRFDILSASTGSVSGFVLPAIDADS